MGSPFARRSCTNQHDRSTVGFVVAALVAPTCEKHHSALHSSLNILIEEAWEAFGPPGLPAGRRAATPPGYSLGDPTTSLVFSAARYREVPGRRAQRNG